jgi:CheY-like chemotaxis protein
VAIKDFFKAKPDPERERSLRDPDQILAWLEELCRIRTVLELRLDAADPTTAAAKVERVGEETSSFILTLERSPAQEPSKGQRAQIVFPLDGQRYQTEMVYLDRGGYHEYRFKLPTAIRHAERRDSIRVNIRSREKIQLVALQGLFDGLAFSGNLVDLSMGGCGFLIHRVIRVKDERRLPIRVDLLMPGTALTLVRLPDLPRLPLLECGGRISHFRQGNAGVSMGIAFEGLGALETEILSRFMQERVPGFRSDFPWKRRYRDLSEEELLVPQPPDEPSDEPLPAPADEAVEALSDEEIQDLRQTIHGENRLGMLKKRGKKVLVVMGDELDRTLLVAVLQQDGYRCLFEARSLIQALDCHRRVPLDFLVLDQSVAHHGALEVLEALRAQGLPKKTPVAIIQRKPDVRLTVAARAGGVNLLVNHPVDFPATLKQPMEALLGIG